MIKDGIGGANTRTGLHFEKNVDLKTLLGAIPGYEIKKDTNRTGESVFFNNKEVARCFGKYSFYKYLEEHNIDWKKIISKRLVPDDALLVIVRDTIFIIEVKFQRVTGSVDEKLQTCDFKKKQYAKLVKAIGLKLEYVYVLSEWFKHPSYKDVLDYVDSVNCHYHFNVIPLSWLGLPQDMTSK